MVLMRVIKYISAIFLFLTYLIFLRYPYHIDLTQDKRYTIHSSIENVVKKLKYKVNIDIYLNGDLPLGYQYLREQVINIIKILKSYNRDFIEYDFVDIDLLGDNDPRKQCIEELGLSASNSLQVLRGKRIEKVIYPCVVMNYNGHQIGINLLNSNLIASQEVLINQGIENVEYNISDALFRLCNDKRKRIALVTGHHEPYDNRTLGLQNLLREYYDVNFVRLTDSLDNFDAAMIIKPLIPFTEAEKYILDQFIMNGGKTIFCLDKMQVDIKRMIKDSRSFAIPLDLNLDDMLFRYGVRLNMNLIKDLQCGIYPIVTGNIGNHPQITMLPIPFLVLLNPNPKHVITKNMNNIYSQFVSDISPISVNGIKHTPLLLSSRNSYCSGNPVIFDLNELQGEQRYDLYSRGPIPSAFLLEGKFKSLFKGRLRPEEVPENTIFKPISVDNKLLVVASGSIALNTITRDGHSYPLGYDICSKQNFANQEFFKNILLYMLYPNGIINSKDKNYKIRLLDTKVISEQCLLVQIINIMTPIVLLILLGIFCSIMRRIFYTR